MKLSRILKTFCRLVLIFFAAVLIFFNAGFYYSPEFESDKSGKWNKDVYQQLTHLKAEVHTGAAAEMQRLFPEGHLFMNALYGLAWLDFAEATHFDTFNNAFLFYEDLPEGEAFREANWALAEMDSPQGRRIFNKDLPLPYGVFYRGWTNYLLAKKLAAIAPGSRPVKDAAEFQKNCDAIARALEQTSSPYLQSYRTGIWPADNVVAVASLKAYDRIYHSSRYAYLTAGWLTKVRTQLDPVTGLIPHVVYEDAPPQGARGSSQSLILSLLPEIDSVFAAEQFALYQKHFVDQRLGLPGIREYPKGTEGTGDIDSGPVIWGIGGAASVVGQRAAYANEDFKLYKGLRNSIETFGCGFTWFGKKRYLFGQLPIADAFIAWSNSVEQTPVNASTTVSWVIHLMSLMILLMIGRVGYKL